MKKKHDFILKIEMHIIFLNIIKSSDKCNLFLKSILNLLQHNKLYGTFILLRYYNVELSFETIC